MKKRAPLESSFYRTRTEHVKVLSRKGKKLKRIPVVWHYVADPPAMPKRPKNSIPVFEGHTSNLLGWETAKRLKSKRWNKMAVNVCESSSGFRYGAAYPLVKKAPKSKDKIRGRKHGRH